MRGWERFHNHGPTHTEGILADLYRPTAEAIRRLGLLREFPGRTEADLYLWVMDHRYFLAQELGADLAPEEVARLYEARFGPWWKRLGGWLKRVIFKSSVIMGVCVS